MMTRKDFEAIAHCLDANFAPVELVLDFADMLEEQNERFDRKRFVRAASENVNAVLRNAVRTLDREAGV